MMSPAPAMYFRLNSWNCRCCWCAITITECGFFITSVATGAIYWLPNLASWAILYAARITRGPTHWMGR